MLQCASQHKSPKLLQIKSVSKKPCCDSFFFFFLIDTVHKLPMLFKSKKSHSSSLLQTDAAISYKIKRDAKAEREIDWKVKLLNVARKKFLSYLRHFTRVSLFSSTIQEANRSKCVW